MTDSRRVAYNTAVQIISRLITAAASVFIVGYLARYLGVAGMGQYNLIFAYLGLFGVVVDFGFFLLQVREIVRRPGEESYILGNLLGFKLALGAVVFGASYAVSLWIYDDPVLTTGILIGAISQAAISLAHIPTSLFQARLEMQKAALVNVVSRLAYVGAIWWAIQQNSNIIGIIWMVSLVNVLALGWQFIWAGTSVKIKPQWDWRYWLSFVREAAPLGVITVLAMLYFRIGTVILSLFQDTYAVGLYTTPQKLLDVVLTVPVIFMSSVFPVLTLALKHDVSRAKTIFQKAFNAAMIMGFPITIGGSLLATPLMVMIAGSDYAASGPVLEALIWVTLLSFAGSVFNYTIIAAERQQALVAPYLVATLFNIVANYLLIPHYSYFGAVFTTIITELLVIIWVAIIVKREFKFLPHPNIVIRAAVCAGVMGVVLWQTEGVNLFIRIGLAGLAYVGLLALSKTLTLKDLRQVLAKT